MTAPRPTDVDILQQVSDYAGARPAQSEKVLILLQNASSPGTFMAAANYPVTNANQIAIADVNGDGHLDIIVASGLSQAIQNGVVTNNPGVLLQNASSPGTFAALADLP